jgi:CRP-like cAMP-binding protein
MAIDDDIAFLERVPTIGLLGRAALRILAIGAETRHLRDGEILFSAGDQADGGYVIQAGQFSLKSSEDGNERTVGPHTLVGEVALFAESKRTATATALERATVLFIPRPLFIRMLDSFPEAAARLREILASRLDQTTRQIANIGTFLDAHEPN